MTSGLSLLGFSASAAFWPGLLGAATTPRWAALAILIPLCLLFVPSYRFREDISAWMFACLFAAGASLFWTSDVYRGTDMFIHLIILAGAFCLGAAVKDISPVWTGFAWGIVISSGLAIAQVFGYEGIAQADGSGPAGLFMNRNAFAEAAAVALIACLVHRRWLLAGLVTPAILLPLSRAVFGALAVVWAIALWKDRPRVCYAILALVVLLAGIALYGNPERTDVWLTAGAGLSWFGHGLGSFAPAFPVMEFAHDEPLQYAYELGLLAVPFAALALYAIGSGTAEPERSIVITVMAVGIFAFPLHLPATAFAFSLAAGHLVGCWDTLRDDVFSGGVAYGSNA